MCATFIITMLINQRGERILFRPNVSLPNNLPNGRAQNCVPLLLQHSAWSFPAFLLARILTITSVGFEVDLILHMFKNILPQRDLKSLVNEKNVFFKSCLGWSEGFGMAFFVQVFISDRFSFGYLIWTLI